MPVSMYRRSRLFSCAEWVHGVGQLAAFAKQAGVDIDQVNGVLDGKAWPQPYTVHGSFGLSAHT